jgi:hypothetical protein
MKELMGTTLPEGSWMIQVKVNGKVKEALYQDLNYLPSSDPDAVKSKAFWDKVNDVSGLLGLLARAHTGDTEILNHNLQEKAFRILR